MTSWKRSRCGFPNPSKIYANRAFRDDVLQASRAVSDLASLRFGLQELVATINAFTERKPEDLHDTRMKLEDCAGLLLGLLGHGEE
jgi:hypothetical protein